MRKIIVILVLVLIIVIGCQNRPAADCQADNPNCIDVVVNKGTTGECTNLDSDCIPEHQTGEGPPRVPEPEMAMSPYTEFEATVVSLSLEDPEGYYEGDEIYRAPEDSAVVRIDKIVETGGSSEFDWSSIGVEGGKEVTLDFKYTVRPTKIITVVGETTQSGDTVSHTIVPTEISYKDNYFVFRVNGNSETEIILLGLEEGSKFKTKLWKTFEVKVGKYEIIS